MNAALAPMKSYTGECVGGPYSGKRLTHWMAIKKHFIGTFGMSVEVGEYRFSKNKWRWFPKYK